MFDAQKETEKILSFIKEYFEYHNLKGVVLGISGGKDSAVVAGLFSLALGPENVIGLTLPCHSSSKDASDASLVAKHFGFELLNLDLTATFDAFVKEAEKLPEAKDVTGNGLSNANINIKPRLRMATNYYVAALYSQIKGGTYVVAGTSNKCELYVGYFTKGGDSTYDIGVLNDLTVEEVIKVGEVIGVPHEVLYKTPSDGLSAKTDEDKMGVSYANIAKVINKELLEGEEYNKIQRLHNNSSHKFNTPKYTKE